MKIILEISIQLTEHFLEPDPIPNPDHLAVGMSIILF